MESHNLQWAQRKAGEDRVHVVVFEEHSWVFVGIYDGFSGTDALNYLLSNLYIPMHKELKGLLWDDRSTPENLMIKEDMLRDVTIIDEDDVCSQCQTNSSVVPSFQATMKGFVVTALANNKCMFIYRFFKWAFLMYSFLFFSYSIIVHYYIFPLLVSIACDSYGDSWI